MWDKGTHDISLDEKELNQISQQTPLITPLLISDKTPSLERTRMSPRQTEQIPCSTISSLETVYNQPTNIFIRDLKKGPHQSDIQDDLLKSLYSIESQDTQVTIGHTNHTQSGIPTMNWDEVSTDDISPIKMDVERHETNVVHVGLTIDLSENQSFISQPDSVSLNNIFQKTYSFKPHIEPIPLSDISVDSHPITPPYHQSIGGILGSGHTSELSVSNDYVSSSSHYCPVSPLKSPMIQYQQSFKHHQDMDSLFPSHNELLESSERSSLHVPSNVSHGKENFHHDNIHDITLPLCQHLLALCSNETDIYQQLLSLISLLESEGITVFDHVPDMLQLIPHVDTHHLVNDNPTSTLGLHENDTRHAYPTMMSTCTESNVTETTQSNVYDMIQKSSYDDILQRTTSSNNNNISRTVVSTSHDVNIKSTSSVSSSMPLTHNTNHPLSTQLTVSSNEQCHIQTAHHQRLSDSPPSVSSLSTDIVHTLTPLDTFIPKLKHELSEGGYSGIVKQSVIDTPFITQQQTKQTVSSDYPEQHLTHTTGHHVSSSLLTRSVLFHGDGSLYLDFFKVYSCTNESHVHDRKNCPYYHSQRDRRRHPIVYKAEQCEDHFDLESDFISACNKGDGCDKCHNRHELLYHPDIYKQRFCSSYNHLECHRGRFCAFAHTRKEIRCQLFLELEEQTPGSEFFMLKFKTLWCPYGIQHDWHGCLYAHTYQDCRRSPSIGYGSEPCPYWQKDLHSADYQKRCPFGPRCPYSHGSKEQLYHPAYYKTMPCADYKTKRNCPRAHLCAFYHDIIEKRSATPHMNPLHLELCPRLYNYNDPLPHQLMTLLQQHFMRPPLFNLDDFEAFGHASRIGSDRRCSISSTQRINSFSSSPFMSRPTTITSITENHKNQIIHDHQTPMKAEESLHYVKQSGACPVPLQHPLIQSTPFHSPPLRHTTSPTHEVNDSLHYVGGDSYPSHYSFMPQPSLKYTTHDKTLSSDVMTHHTTSYPDIHIGQCDRDHLDSQESPPLPYYKPQSAITHKLTGFCDFPRTLYKKQLSIHSDYSPHLRTPPISGVQMTRHRASRHHRTLLPFTNGMSNEFPLFPPPSSSELNHAIFPFKSNREEDIQYQLRHETHLNELQHNGYTGIDQNQHDALARKHDKTYHPLIISSERGGRNEGIHSLPMVNMMTENEMKRDSNEQCYKSRSINWEQITDTTTVGTSPIHRTSYPNL